jgi:DNA-binding HxlR family transcriptional regulator
MSTPYSRSCPVARTLEIIGDRWTILIVRDLLLKGPRKFIDLELSLQGISPNTLSARLKTLEETGLIERRFYEQHPPRAEYLLTAKGRELGPVLRALRDWGQKHTPPTVSLAREADAERDRVAEVAINTDNYAKK